MASRCRVSQKQEKPPRLRGLLCYQSVIKTWCQDAPQLWVKDSWHEKFGLDADPDDTGQGWSEDQVAGWQLPAKNLLVDYYDVVKAAAREHIQPLSASDLKRQMSWGATIG